MDRITLEAFEIDASAIAVASTDNPRVLSPSSGAGASAPSGGTLVTYMLFSRSVFGSFDWSVNQGRVERLAALLEDAVDAKATSRATRQQQQQGGDGGQEGRTRQSSYGTAEGGVAARSRGSGG